MNTREERIALIRERTGKIRDRRKAPYDWLDIWNSACHELVMTTGRAAFNFHKLEQQ